MKIKEIRECINQAAKIHGSICLTIEMWPTSFTDGETYHVWIAKDAKGHNFATLMGAVDYIKALGQITPDESEELTVE